MRRLSDDFSPFARWCSKFREGLHARKASIQAGTTLETMIRSQNAFEEVHQKDVWMPVGPPLSKGTRHDRIQTQRITQTASIDQSQNTHINLAGEFMREIVKVGLPLLIRFRSDSASTQAFIKGTRALVLHNGMSLEECTQLELDAIRDIESSSTPLFLRLNCVWAQKLAQQL
jgi:hypothetical protein